jgi:hypothetical protein
MVAPNLTLGQGLTIGKGIVFGAGTAGGTVDPATNTGGISLSMIAGLPQNLYPGVSVVGAATAPGGGTIANAQFIVNPTSTYGTPSGFTFLSSWSWAQFDPTLVAVTTTNTYNDTATALSIGYPNNAVLGSVVIPPNFKVMFSVNHSVWCGAVGYDGVGVGSATTPYIGYNSYLGLDTQSIGIYDDGSVFTNNGFVASGYAVFETNGQIIDVAVDTVNNKMWYRVAGGAWQG